MAAVRPPAKSVDGPSVEPSVFDDLRVALNERHAESVAFNGAPVAYNGNGIRHVRDDSRVGIE